MRWRACNLAALAATALVKPSSGQVHDVGHVECPATATSSFIAAVISGETRCGVEMSVDGHATRDNLNSDAARPDNRNKFRGRVQKPRGDRGHNDKRGAGNTGPRDGRQFLRCLRSLRGYRHGSAQANGDASKQSPEYAQ